MATKPRELDKTIARMAASQFGVVTYAQLTGAGVSRHVIRRRLQAGRLVRLGTHTYLVSGAPRTWNASALAACLDLGPDAFICQRSAAFVWQLRSTAPEVIDIVVPSTHTARRDSTTVKVHRSKGLSGADGVVVRGLPVTSIGRTLIDLAAVALPDEFDGYADVALCRRLVSPRRLQKSLDQLARRGRQGTPHLRRVLAPWLAGDRVESVAEAQVLRAIEAADLPRPVTQYEVRSPTRKLVGRVDFAWPEQQVVLEVDGFRWHAKPAAQVDDIARANRLAALGWIVLRTTPAEMAAGGSAMLAALGQNLGGRTASKSAPNT
jgi:hypothetical protein